MLGEARRGECAGWDGWSEKELARGRATKLQSVFRGHRSAILERSGPGRSSLGLKSFSCSNLRFLMLVRATGYGGEWRKSGAPWPRCGCRRVPSSHDSVVLRAFMEQILLHGLVPLPLQSLPGSVSRRDPWLPPALTEGASLSPLTCTAGRRNPTVPSANQGD